MDIVNIKTGEVISSDSPVVAMSEARRHAAMKIKELEPMIKQLDEWMLPHVKTALENGERVADYWIPVKGRLRFNRDAFEAAAPSYIKEEYSNLKEKLREIEQDYLMPSEPYIMFPKM